MYKLVLNDGTRYDIVEPAKQTTVTVNGVATEAVQFTLVDTDLVLKTIKATFQDELAVADFDITFEDGTVAARYTNYSKLARIGINEQDQYYVIMALTSDLPALLAAVEKKVKTHDSTLNKLKDDFSTATESLKETDKKVEKLPDTVRDNLTKYTEAIKTNLDSLAQDMQTLKTAMEEEVYDPETASLEEVKSVQIEMSKYNLKSYLETHPITSSVHGGVPKQYSITSEKQQYLAQMIMLAEGYEKLAAIAKQKAEESEVVESPMSEMEFHISWNAVGEPCTYDWTLEELYLLSAQIEQVVRPLISKQQEMEAAINRAISKSDVNSISIEFE